MEEFIDSAWKVKLPNKWQGEHSDECATFYHTDGVGALQITTFEKEREVQPEDLQMLAEELLTPGIEISELRIGDFRGFSFELEDEAECWRYWFVSAGEFALAIAYNCDIEDRDKEAGVVLEILRSLRVLTEE